MRRLAISVALSATIAISFQFAGVIPVTASDDAPTSQEIIDALLPRGLHDAKRGARSLDAALGGRGITVSGDEPEIPSINLRVAFEYDSDALSNDGMLTLQRLGEALTNDALANARFRVVGHTDARGTDEYNDDLSRRRASAVTRYLGLKFGVSEERLDVAGRGKQHLIDGIPPEDERNRRVEIQNISDER